MDRLSAFLLHEDGRPWRPGHVDCCLPLADWAQWLGHADPAAHLRGAYDSEAGFFAIADAAGGLVPLVSDCAARISARRIQRPFRGAIGVIGSPHNRRRQFGAIHDGVAWQVRFISGFSPLSARALAIWSLECRA
jgi:hypothetical protein